MAHILSTLLVLMALLGVLVVFHELGHFISAKLLRMKVHEFAFGFGPIIARLFKRGDTEFNIRSVPLGGFVRIAGMEPEEEDVEGGFNAAPIWHRAVVVLSGPFMSLLLGYIVFTAIGLVWGFQALSADIAEVVAKTPAVQAGLKANDRLIAINGSHINSGSIAQEIIRKNAGKPITITILRDGKTLTLTAKPESEYSPAARKKVGQLGILLKPRIIRPGVIGSIRLGTEQTIEAVGGIISTLFSKRIAHDIGGIVAIGVVTSEVVKSGIQQIFMELALLSVMLGVINLIPWPILDGGHILYLIVEKIRGKKLEPDRWYAVQTFGLAALVFLAVFLVYFDFARILAHKLP